MTLAALALLLGAAWLPGRLVTRHVPQDDSPFHERVALSLVAGLGIVALVLSILAVAGVFHVAVWIVAIAAIASVVGTYRQHLLRRVGPDNLTARGAPPPRAAARLATLARRGSGLSRDDALRATPFGLSAAKNAAAWRLLPIAYAIGVLGAIAPVTDDDALAYVIPIARRIAETGTLAFWPDLARSMWPQSQEVLLAFMIRMGATRLGALTAVEFVLFASVVAALGRRLCERPDRVATATALAIGSPVVAFQVASAKEDLLVAAAAAATVWAVVTAQATLKHRATSEIDSCHVNTRAQFVAAGVFCGAAAGAKYSGVAIAAGVVIGSAVSAGRGRRWSSATWVAAGAIVTGGFWYALNVWRFANPVAPMIWGAAGTTLDAAAVQSWTDAFGGARGALDLLAAPVRMFLDPDRFASRANLFNPGVYAALAALAVARLRARHGIALVTAACIYAAWYAALRNPRLLLPAAAVMAPAAADVLGIVSRRMRLLRPVVALALALPIVLVASVGAVRFARYAADPSSYLERETQRYRDIAWMNAHLDPARHRVGSRVKVLGFLRIPSLVLDASYQTEMSYDELWTLDRTLEACRRRGVTHLFGRADEFEEIRPHLRLVYDNPASRLGGLRFFRAPPVEHTAVFEIVR